MRRSSPDDMHTVRLVEALSTLVLDVFRLNGDLLTFGDALVGDLGLSSARWQVLGAVALSPVPLPVAHVARNMGLSRQAVQRVVNEMRADGLVRLDPNPHHRRAGLVAMTERGKAAYDSAMRREARWAEVVTDGFNPDDIEAAARTLRALQQRLDSMAGYAGQAAAIQARFSDETGP